MTDGDGVRRLTPADVDWVVSLARQRRESLVRHAPRFWASAAEATARHGDFLAHLIAAPEAVGLRTAHGFLIALHRGATWLVDDAAVSDHDGGGWAGDGLALLRHAQDRCGALRLVFPVFETDRMAAAARVGLVPVEHWWHRDLDPVAASVLDTADADPSVVVPGASGRLVPAPPVYDPGGPVLLVVDLESAAALRAIEGAAARRGARVSVVTQVPADERVRSLVTAAGYVLTTAFCERP